jgi:hypothetical protein
LAFPQQKLLEVTAGGVFHDGLGFAAVRERFSYFPEDVWVYLLACQWERIGQEEPFVGRTGDLGDDLGSRLIAARLAQDLMRLAFLLERRYAPYSKWFGVAFRRLEAAGSLGPLLEAALAAGDWKGREAHLAQAYELMAERQNALALTAPLSTQTTGFYNRPYRVLFADRFARALQARIQDPSLRQLPLYGSVDQFCTTTDILSSNEALEKLRGLYG